MSLIKEFFYEKRIEFILENDENLFSYEMMEEAILKIIQPESQSAYEITSWTQGFSFTKEDIQVFFFEFYHSEPAYFSFEILPCGEHSAESIQKLRSWLNNLEKYIQEF